MAKLLCVVKQAVYAVIGVGFRVYAAMIVIGVLVYAFSMADMLALHYFNRDRLEAARRASCQNSLREIAIKLNSAELSLDENHLTEINIVLKHCGHRCPSGGHEGVGNPIYFARVNAPGRVVITEHESNHDSSHMPYVDLPHVRHELNVELQVQEVLTREQVR